MCSGFRVQDTDASRADNFIQNEWFNPRDQVISGFQTTVENPMRRLFLRPITTGTNSAMNQSEFLEISCNLLNAREESLVQVAIGFGFASHWLKNWRQGF